MVVYQSILILIYSINMTQIWPLPPSPWLLPQIKSSSPSSPASHPPYCFPGYFSKTHIIIACHFLAQSVTLSISCPPNLAFPAHGLYPPPTIKQVNHVETLEVDGSSLKCDLLFHSPTPFASHPLTCPGYYYHLTINSWAKLLMSISYELYTGSALLKIMPPYVMISKGA